MVDPIRGDLFGRMAVARRVITDEQLQKCLEIQKGDPDRRLGEILIEQGYMTAEEVERVVLSQQRRNLARGPGAPTLAYGVLDGETIEGFRVAEEAAQGAYSAVLEVIRDGETFAMKIFDEECSHAIGDRIRRDACAVGGEDAPPGLMRCVLGRTYKGHSFTVSEWLDGSNLVTELNGEGKALAVCVKELLGLARAVQHGHAQGVVHGDIRPRKLMRCDRGIVLRDFGMAPRTVHEVPARGRGELGYLAPEQLLEAGHVGPRADIYALGALLYHWVTGRPPYEGKGEELLQAIRERRPPLPSKLKPGTPRAVDAVCFHAMDMDARRRYGDIAAFIADLERLGRGDKVAAPAASGISRLFSWLRKN